MVGLKELLNSFGMWKKDEKGCYEIEIVYLLNVNGDKWYK